MKSSWVAAAIGTPPPAPGSFSNGYPTDGNPSLAIPPTEPGAYWFYMVTQEIVNAITAAGLTPSTGTLNQLAAAIALLGPVQSVNGRAGAVTGVVDLASFTGANQSLASSGYQKLPGGLILQWGSVHVGDIGGGGSGTTGSASFPITFPTGVLRLMASIEDASVGSLADAPYIASKSVSGFNWVVQEWATATQDTTLVFLALGY